MSMPPQGGWPPPNQPGPPPNQGQPFGPQYNPQQPPPGWQQGAWSPQPTPPPQKGGSLKWLLVAVAVLLVIGITVGATLLFTRDNGGGGTTTSTSGAPSDIASANDTGPVTIITDEPTCDAFVGINNSLADIQGNGWGAQRNALGPVAEWTPDQRTEVEAVANATRNAADQMIRLVRQTPHRVVRELYQQFIAFGRAYADNVANYTPSDNGLASANVNASSALVGICNAITYGSAGRSLAVDPASPPLNPAEVSDPGNPTRFITANEQACSSFQQLSDKFNEDTAEWQQLDSDISAAQWTPQQRSLQRAAMPFLSSWASDMEQVGRSSQNPVLEDFSATAAVYLRAYVAVGDNYTSADSWLSYVSVKLNQLVLGACRAAVG
ncbi:hypothetical protein [Mycobacterium antarcticum]|nr:hypothetical protein [Mycolicibacterium sp. TUM20985]